MFPSPYGVSFILIKMYNLNSYTTEDKFPSPYGVSFILIYYRCYRLIKLKAILVSVSLRSIIHSYRKRGDKYEKMFYLCFRLLTEYHSFLYK